jgi:molybdopterin-guanine dinucleotide biosynthesis protein A
MPPSTQTAPDKISCIILAGGRGQRMGGSDKGLQQYRHRRLIEHVIDRVSPQVDDIIISANRNLTEYNRLGFSVVQDNNNKYDGPLAGIKNAMPHCRNPWVLVIPCDMPVLPVNLVATLRQHIDGSSLVTVRCNNRLQLLFLMHNSLLHSISDFLANDQRTVMHWLQTVDTSIVDIDNDNYFHNINTLEELLI